MTFEIHYRPEMLVHVPANAKRILDVGCADGNFGASVKRKVGVEVWGVDLPSAQVSKAQQVLDKVIVGPIDVEETLNQLPDHSFDAIFFNDVLEHLLEPDKLLTLIKKKLTPQGVIVAAIPNVRHFRVLRDLMFRKDWVYVESGVIAYSHLRFFTKKSMMRLFENAGYDVLSINGINTTKSIRPYIYFVFTLGLFGLDTRFLQFAIVARPQKLL